MQILQGLHVAVLVSDLDKAKSFYGEVLGLQRVDRNLRFPGAWYEVNGFQIHLITASVVSNDRVNLEKWGRNRHVAFAVADLEAAKEQLLTHDCPIQMSASGRAALFTQDPDGNLIELSQV